MKKNTWLTMLVFRILGGIVSIAAGVLAFVLLLQLVPLFSDFVKGTMDPYRAFLILTAFFIGAPFTVYVGLRMLFLRAFRSTKMYMVALFITSGVLLLTDLPLISDMDKAMSFSIYYLMGVVGLSVVLYAVHRDLYTPVSHEKLHHVGYVEPDHPVRFLKTLYVVAFLSALLALHPLSIDESLRMLVSPLVDLFYLLKGLVG